MAFDASRGPLWLYRQADRTGLLSIPLFRRAYELIYRRYKRHIEDPFYNLVRRQPELFAGGHILDVGANIGYTSEVFAGALDLGFQVWAFEPSSDHVRRLRAQVERRGLGQVLIVRHAAVSDRCGASRLVLNLDNPADHRLPPLPAYAQADRPTETVTLTTIDDEMRAAALRPIAFIKIDVQGCELGVCRGMTQTLADNPGASVAVEFMPALMRTYGDDPGDLPKFFAHRGFAAFAVTQGGLLRPMSPRDFREAMPGRGYVDVLFRRPRGDRQR